MPKKVQHKSREEQRQELLDEDAKIKREASKQDKPGDTVPGYAGPSATTVAGTPPESAEKPKGVVIGEGGTITKPTEITISAGYKKPTDAKRFIGLALLEGNTFHGYEKKLIVELTEAVTLEGAFNVFKSHVGPEAILDGFKVKVVTKEEAKELTDEWLKEGAVPGQAPSGDQDEDGED
jgi:hypothetical protein